MTIGASQGVPQTNFGWAAKYRAYLDAYIQRRNGQIPILLKRLVPIIQSDISKAKGIKGSVQSILTQEQNLANAIQSAYLVQNAGIDFSITWEWNVNNVKRAEILYGNKATCSLSSVLQSSSSSVSTVSDATVSQTLATTSDTILTSANTASPTPVPKYNLGGASSCAGGSSLCNSNPKMDSKCQNALARWNYTESYNAYPSLSYTDDLNKALANEGCSASLDCGTQPNPAISGADLRMAFGLINCPVCGSHQLPQSGCVVRLDV